MKKRDTNYPSTADTIQMDLHTGIIPCLKCGHHIRSNVVNCPSCGSTQTKMQDEAKV